MGLGVDVSKGKARCRGCHQYIKSGEKRFYYLGDVYYNRPVYYYWHPECYLKFNGKAIRDIVALFLPLLIGEEEAAPIIVALKMSESFWRGRYGRRYNKCGEQTQTPHLPKMRGRSIISEICG